MKLERDIVRGIKMAVEAKYGDDAWVYKTHDSVRVGVPDLIICVRGRFVALEVKRPGKEMEIVQKMEIMKIRRAGSVHSWSVDNVPDAMSAIEKTLQMNLA